MRAGRVLITGRYGFTGAYVADELMRAGWEVWGIGANTAPKPDARYFVADLVDREAITRVIEAARPDTVIHLAAITFVAHDAAEDFYRINVIGTRILLDVLARTGTGSDGVVLASSANVYGNSTTSPIPETVQPEPVNDYAVSKLSMEYMSWLFADRLPLVITRPFNYTGRGQNVSFLIPKIVTHFRDRAPRIELGNLDVARDFSDVRDVARAYRRILETAPQGETLNICSGQATRLGDVLDICRTLTGHDIAVSVNPAFVRSNEIKILTGDPTRLDALPDGVERYALKDTLRWMLEEA